MLTKGQPRWNFSGLKTSALITAFCILLPGWTSADTPPTLELFPKEVTYYLKETGSNAKLLEDNLRGSVDGFDKQMALYKNSHCEEADNDPGCNEIKARMEDHYRDILATMKEHLPEIKASLNSASNGLEKRIANQIGRKMRPRDIQRQISDKTMPRIYKGQFSMSKRFSDYHKLIGRNSSSQLMAIASEIYLDTSSSREWLNLIEADIAQQEIVLDVFEMYGEVTPDMINTLNGVKTVLFGEVVEEEGYQPDLPMQAEAESPWVLH